MVNKSLLATIHPLFKYLFTYFYKTTIGETIDESDQICGSRVVDQSRKGKIAYKIEIWLRSTDDKVASRIKSKLGAIIADGVPNQGKPPDFEFNKRNNP